MDFIQQNNLPIFWSKKERMQIFRIFDVLGQLLNEIIADIEK